MTLCLFVFWEEARFEHYPSQGKLLTYFLYITKKISLSKTRSQMFVKWNRNSSRKKRNFFQIPKRSLMITGVDMKFKSKPIKIEQDSCTSSGSDLDIAEAMRSLSPLPRSSIHQPQPQPQSQQLQPQDDSLSDLEQNNNPNLTKLPSPSPIRKWHSS